MASTSTDGTSKLTARVTNIETRMNHFIITTEESLSWYLDLQIISFVRKQHKIYILKTLETPSNLHIYYSASKCSNTALC